MIISFTLFFGAISYLFYMSKEEVSLIDEISTEKTKEDEDLYKDLEDLFI